MAEKRKTTRSKAPKAPYDTGSRRKSNVLRGLPRRSYVGGRRHTTADGEDIKRAPAKKKTKASVTKIKPKTKAGKPAKMAPSRKTTFLIDHKRKTYLAKKRAAVRAEYLAYEKEQRAEKKRKDKTGVTKLKPKKLTEAQRMDRLRKHLKAQVTKISKYQGKR